MARSRPASPEGLLLILRAYFDDSGTHSGSDVAVMGG